MKVFNDYNIIATPTILVFRNDKPMFEHIGMIKKNELIELLFDGK
jgi:hypothetical protein